MTVFEIIFAVALLIFSVAIILVVLLQEGNQKNMGAITFVMCGFHNLHLAH